MDILAFSDWRIQNIELFINYLESLNKTPDIIVYAGDDIRRFNQVPYQYLPRKRRNKYRAYTKNRLLKMMMKTGDYSLHSNIKSKKFIDLVIEENFRNKSNYFEKIASYSKHGLCVVAGNDDPPFMRHAIHGKKVYNIHDNPLFIENYAFMGQEGSSGTIGKLLYSEDRIRKHLDTFLTQVDNRQIIIVSHTPPYKILDFAIRYGEKHIGSTSLRDLIQDHSNDVKLVISGHVHRQGGKSKKFDNVYIVNCASHDNEGSPGLIAMINVSKEHIKINWSQVHDPYAELQTIPLVGPATARLLMDNNINNVNQLAEMKLPNSIPQETRNLIRMYAKAKSINEPIVNKKLKSPLDEIKERNIYFFDAEYDPSGTKSGPYGLFLLGWMNSEGKIDQLFLDDPNDELKLIQDFHNWMLQENPLLVAYSSKTADEPHLRYSFRRFNLSTDILENRFFDIFSNFIFTRSAKRQKIYLPIKPLTLKHVSDYLGYKTPNINISDGLQALYEYESFLRKKRKVAREGIKRDLLVYNKDDVERVRFVFNMSEILLKNPNTP